MSNNGTTQNSLAIRKANLSNQKIGASFRKNLEFSHVANAGDKVISFGSLSANPTLVTLEGFINPQESQLVGAAITQNKANVRIHSSAKGELMRGEDFYIREDNQIRLNYEAEQDEIFHGVVVNVDHNTPAILDVKKISFTGSLAEGATDVAVGAEYNINANPSTQLGDLVVYRWQDAETPKLMVRCEGNNIANDGNYIEKNGAIEFKTVGRVGGENIAIFSPNCIPTQYQNSFKQDLETLGGQVDAIAEFLQDIHSLPSNPFQGAPNQVDLRAFGQKVIDNEAAIATKQDAISIPWSRVTPAATTSALGFIMGFSGLTVGKWYEITGQIKIDANEFSSNAKRYSATIRDSEGNIHKNIEVSASNVFEYKQTIGLSFKFQALAGDVYFDAITADNMALQGGFINTLMEIEEAQFKVNGTTFNPTN